MYTRTYGFSLAAFAVTFLFATSVAADSLLTIRIKTEVAVNSKKVMLQALATGETTTITQEKSGLYRASIKDHALYRVVVLAQGFSPAKFTVETGTSDSFHLEVTLPCLRLLPGLNELSFYWQGVDGSKSWDSQPLENGKARIKRATAKPYTALVLSPITTNYYATTAGLNRKAEFNDWTEYIPIDSKQPFDELIFDVGAIPDCDDRGQIAIRSNNAAAAEVIKLSFQAHLHANEMEDVIAHGRQSEVTYTTGELVQSVKKQPASSSARTFLAKLVESPLTQAKDAEQVLSLLAPDDVLWTFRTSSLGYFSSLTWPKQESTNSFTIWQRDNEANIFSLASKVRSKPAASYLMERYVYYADPWLNAEAFDALIHKAMPYTVQENALAEIRKARERKAALKIGNRMPAFTLQSRDGTEIISSESVRGKVYLLDFWATWCIPCRETYPTIERIVGQFDSSELMLISVAMNSSEAELARWFKRFKKPTHLVNVEDELTRERFGIPYIPHLLLVDANGYLVGKYTTDLSHLEQDIRKLLVGSRIK